MEITDVLPVDNGTIFVPSSCSSSSALDVGWVILSICGEEASKQIRMLLAVSENLDEEHSLVAVSVLLT